MTAIAQHSISRTAEHGGRRKRFRWNTNLFVAPALISLAVIFVQVFPSVKYPNPVKGLNNSILTSSHSEMALTRARPSIAYCISISFCMPNQIYSMSSINEGAAVLAHSIQQIHEHSNYDYKLYAIVFSSGRTRECSKHLVNYGYELFEQEIPIDIKELKETKPSFFKLLKERGCCGARELMKLIPFQFVQHDLVMHLDNDMIFLQPIDELFDAMLSNDATTFQNIVTMGQQPLPTRIDVMFTRDYLQPNRNEPTSWKKFPIQGGFILAKPSLTLYQEMVHTVSQGNFTIENGWEGSKVGNFYGDAQVQGLFAFIWGYKYHENAVELDRCIYNTHIEDDGIMCKNSSQRNCDDCSQTPFDQIKFIHFTTCQKPWTCGLPWRKNASHSQCRKGHRSWFQMRKAIEVKYSLQVRLPESHEQEWTLGYCQVYPSNETAYVPMHVPGEPVVAMTNDT